ncbi:hypothetical protein PtB15_12B273 [Puccinia triticina]|nr:hypothetical protein PtB15_12B273 [Puccinia triticina]
MASSIKQATAIIKRIAGIAAQNEVGTEDPPVALQVEEDEVPDLNPPKKGKKGSSVKEAPRKITTRSTSKAPEDTPQQVERQPGDLDGWKTLLGTVGGPKGKRAANPEESTSTPLIDQGRKKRDRPGPGLNPVETEAVPAESTAADAVPPWKIQQKLVAMVEWAMKAEAEGDSVMASRLYDIGLKVPVPPSNEIDLTGEHQRGP